MLRALPTIWKLALSVEPAPVTKAKEKVLPASGSMAVNAPTVAPSELFSATNEDEIASAVGASFTSITAIVNTCSVDNPPWSVALTRMEPLGLAS